MAIGDGSKHGRRHGQIDGGRSRRSLSKRRVEHNLLLDRAKTKRVLVQLDSKAGQRDGRSNILEGQLELDSILHLAETAHNVNAARLIGGTNLRHDGLGLIRVAAAEDVAEATGSSGRLGLLTDAHSTHIKEIDTASGTAGSSDVILILILFLLLFFVFLINGAGEVGHGATSANNECFRGLVVDGTEGCNLADKDIEQMRLELVSIILDDRLVTKNNELCSLGIRRQKTPVDETKVTEIGIVGLLGGEIEDALDHVLSILGILEEALHGGREQPKLNGRVLLLECLQEAIEKLVGIVNALGILANDPDHTGLGLRLIERVQVITEGRDDGLVSVRVTTEDILDNNDALLNDVIDLV